MNNLYIKFSLLFLLFCFFSYSVPAKKKASPSISISIDKTLMLKDGGEAVVTVSLSNKSEKNKPASFSLKYETNNTGSINYDFVLEPSKYYHRFSGNETRFTFKVKGNYQRWGSSDVDLSISIYGLENCTAKGSQEVRLNIVNELNPDVEAPIALCKNDVRVSLDGTGRGSLAVADVNDSSTDNITTPENLTLSLDRTNFDCSDIFRPGENYALDFDGNNDYVKIVNEINLQIRGKAITVEAWVKLDSGDDWTGIVMKTSDGNWRDGYGLYYHRGKINFYVSHYTNYAWESYSADGQWHHIAGVYNGEKVSIYVDGVQGNNFNYKRNVSNTNHSLEIGRGKSNSYNLKGKVDDVRIWSVVRSEQEINSAKNIELSGNENGLEGYWNFDDGTGSSLLNDATANGNNGTLINMDVASDWVAGAPNGRGAVTLTVEDEAGNVSKCSSTLIIEDALQPSFSSTPGDLNEDGVKPQPYPDYSSFKTVGGEVADNCGVDTDSFKWVSDELVGNNPEVVHRTYSIADDSGNTATYVQTITINSKPKIIDFNPKNVCSSTNSDVTITGTGLANATEVIIGDKIATIKSNTASQIVISLPADATTGPISVTTPSGTETSTPLFTVNSLPADAGYIRGADIVLPGEPKTYVCDPIIGATSYEWNLDGVIRTTADPQLDLIFADDASPGDRILTVKGVNESCEGADSPPLTIYVRYKDPCQTAIVNWNFNEPDLGSDNWQGYRTVNGWQSSLNNIEIWSDKMPNVPSGEQCCELNSIGQNEMWQDVFTVPGDEMRWSINYRYRSNASESIEIRIGTDGALVDVSPISNKSGDGWVSHSGLYTVPDGQTITQFRIVSVNSSPGSRSSGNLIDDVRFYPIELDKEKPTFNCPTNSDQGCIDATSVVLDNIGVTNLADNCTAVDDLSVEYKIENTAYSNPLVNFGDDPDGNANSEDASGFAFPIGMNTVTYRVTDKSNNSTIKRFTININRKPTPIGIFHD